MRAFWIPLLLLTPALGQENEPPAPEPEPGAAAGTEHPQALFATAMLDLKNMDEIVVRAKIRRKPAEAAGFAGGRVVLGAGGEAATPFEGVVEAWRDRDGSVVVVSEEELPGFALYGAAGRTLQRQDYEEEPVSLAELEAELVPLLDPDRLTQHLMAADLAERRDSTGRLVFEGAAPRELVKVIPSAAFMVGKRTLRAKAKVVLSAEGRLEQVAVAIVHNDPLREMMRGKGFRVVLGPNGQPQPQPGGDDEESHDIEGETVTYSLEFGKTEPSERARAARRDLKRLLEKG